MGLRGRRGLRGDSGHDASLPFVEKRGWFPPLYAFDTPSLYAQHHSARQRPKSRIDLETLRRLASTYDPMRACIQHLKAEVAAVPGKIVVRDPLDQSSTARINQASEWFFSRHGGLGGLGRRRRHFEDEIFEDALVLGQFAVHVEETRGGIPYEVNAVDAATIRPKVNSFGWIDPADAYEQQVMGVVVRPSLSMSELIVDGLNAVSYQPYFVSPVEWLIGVALSALKADEWNRTWLTDGNVPDQLIAVPKDWTPDQMQAYAGYFDALLSGGSDLRERRKAKIVPDGTKPVWSQSRKDSDFQAFELWLLRRTCSIFGVQPASIGYAGEQYKVSQEGSLRQTTQFGVGRLLELRKDLYDELLDRLGYPELEWRNVVEGEEDPLERARRLQIAVGGPWMTVAEARQEEGLSGSEGT